MVSTGISSIDGLLNGGYPDKSAILIVGPPGIGKEALGYWFVQKSLVEADFCLYATRLSSSEVYQDAKGFGINFSKKVPFWFASSGGEMKFDVNDLARTSITIKQILKDNSQRKIGIVFDALSSLLMLNPSETIYKFLTQLFAEVKQYDSVLLATLEEGMHEPQVIAAMEQLFDGVLELKLYEEGLRVVPLLRIRKMRGVPPQPGYYNFSFTKTGMEVSPHAQ